MVLCKNIDESLAVIQKWVKNNSTLPKIEPIVLKHFVNVCEGNIQETEKLIKLHYTVRNNYSNLFIERDPLDPGTQIIMKATDVMFLPKLTPDNYVIQISRIADPDPDKYLFVESVKNCAMFYDLLLYTMSDKDQIIDGIITIFDAKGFSLKHMAKVNFAAFRGFVKFFEKTIAFKIRQIHVTNCPPHINKILSLCKPFLSEHVNKMINLHESNSETLFKYISKDLLPIEFDGTATYSIESLKQKQIQDLKDYRNYLIDPSYWKMKGDLPKNDNDAANGIEGSFKTLSFD